MFILPFHEAALTGCIETHMTKGRKSPFGVTKSGHSSWDSMEECLPRWSLGVLLCFFYHRPHSHPTGKECTGGLWLERHWKKTSSSRQRVWWHSRAVCTHEAKKTEFPATQKTSKLVLVTPDTSVNVDILDLWRHFIQQTGSQQTCHHVMMNNPHPSEPQHHIYTTFSHFEHLNIAHNQSGFDKMLHPCKLLFIHKGPQALLTASACKLSGCRCLPMFTSIVTFLLCKVKMDRKARCLGDRSPTSFFLMFLGVIVVRTAGVAVQNGF